MYFSSIESGKLTLGGYPGSLIKMIIEKEYLDKEKYHLFVSQFKLHSDFKGSWRGEFWGKFVRGAVECYKANKDERLYKTIEESVFEIVGYVEEDGTLSSYTKEYRLTGWDIWSRKYAMLGLLSYLEIAKSKSKKRKVLNSIKKQANSIMAYVGRGKNKKGILDTSNVYGSLNSASLLGAYVLLYSLTGIKKYLSFAKYIVSTGLCAKQNIIKNTFKKDSYPYQWEAKKAYEMIECFQWLLRYGLITKDDYYVQAAINFAHKVYESEFTIIGGLGTESEFFNHSSLTQTSIPSKQGLETCVTVSFMSLCDDLLKATGDSFYASLIETMSYNALFGATNDEGQKMNLAEGRVWKEEGGYVTPAHEQFFFDSYTPLVKDRRAKLVGGFMVLQNGRSYGCCAANGGYGLGLVRDFAFLKKENGFVINFYSDFKANSTINDKKVSFSLKGDLFTSGKIKLKIKGYDTFFSLSLRIPTWGTPIVTLNGKRINGKEEKGYFIIDRTWGDDLLCLDFSLPIEAHYLNDKVAFTRGPIVLSRDERLGEVSLPIDKKDTYKFKVIKNDSFKNNETLVLDNDYKLCDFASSAKNMDDLNSKLSVWIDIKK